MNRLYLFAFALLLSACQMPFAADDADGVEPDGLVGSWRLDYSVERTTETTSRPEGYTSTIIFRADGTYTTLYTSSEHGDHRNDGTYRLATVEVDGAPQTVIHYDGEEVWGQPYTLERGVLGLYHYGWCGTPPLIDNFYLPLD